MGIKWSMRGLWVLKSFILDQMNFNIWNVQDRKYMQSTIYYLLWKEILHFENPPKVVRKLSKPHSLLFSTKNCALFSPVLYQILSISLILMVIFPSFFYSCKTLKNALIHTIQVPNQHGNKWELIHSHPCGKRDASPLNHQWIGIILPSFTTHKMSSIWSPIRHPVKIGPLSAQQGSLIHGLDYNRLCKREGILHHSSGTQAHNYPQAYRQLPLVSNQ